MRRFRICALKHVGRLWTKNPFRSPMPKPAGRYIMRRSLKTVIHANSFFREAFTCYIRRNPCGRNHSAYAPASCSGSIPIDIKKAYYLSMRLGLIYHQCRYKDAALTHLARWYDEVEKSGFLAFGRVARSVQMHYREIINFFDRRSTNAASESFNAKIKEFRTQFRGVKDRAFFLFRLAKIYA